MLGYIGWRAGTITLCNSQLLYIPLLVTLNLASALEIMTFEKETFAKRRGFYNISLKFPLFVHELIGKVTKRLSRHEIIVLPIRKKVGLATLQCGFYFYFNFFCTPHP